jgi:hypothetical protein
VLYSREDRDKESLVFAESALYYHGRDAGTLESLMLAYANVGNLAAAGAVYHELLSCCKDEAVRARARDFARRRLPAGEP